MKYSKKTIKTICDLMKKGASRTHAAEGAGINYKTLREWEEGKIPAKILKKCKTEEEIEKKKSEFCEAIKKAHDEYHDNLKMVAEQTIRETFTKGKVWQAAAWYLERKHKAEYAQRVINTGDKENPLHHQHEIKGKIDFSGLTIDELKRLATLGEASGSEATGK